MELSGAHLGSCDLSHGYLQPVLGMNTPCQRKFIGKIIVLCSILLLQVRWMEYNEFPTVEVPWVVPETAANDYNASKSLSNSNVPIQVSAPVSTEHGNDKTRVQSNSRRHDRDPVTTKPVVVDGVDRRTNLDPASDSPYAYVFAIWRLDPDKQNHKGYLANILIATRILRLQGSTADFVILVKLHYDSKHSVLPNELVQLFTGMKIRIHYLAQQHNDDDDDDDDDRKLNVYGTMFYKFAIFNLTEYRQVMYLDSDMMPMNNLDYLMQQADHGFLKPYIMIASNREPANGGMFIVRPNQTVYQHIQSIIHTWGDRLAKSQEWDELVGWGHVIEPPDCWETNNHRNKGIKWNFWAANADQGFFYYYCKYVLKECTQILARRIINFGGGGGVGESLQWNVTSLATSPFTNVAPKKAYSFTPGNCGYVTFLTSPNWPGCVPPYRDFRHYTGRSKPWQQDRPATTRKRDPRTSDHLWWHTLVELRDVEGLNTSVLGIPLPY